jgi:calcineurin-like phosphoesterase family protein
MKKPIKYFVISDTHWLHDKAVEFCNRPTDFTQKIIKQWNLVVRPQDIVINLGDVIWGNKAQLSNIMNQLPGTKILVKGNHDKHGKNWFIEAGFSFVADQIVVGNFVLSHTPVWLTKRDIAEGKINIHGHFHNVKFERWEKKLVERLTDNHYLLSIEFVGYKPIELTPSIVDRKHVIPSLELKNR